VIVKSHQCRNKKTPAKTPCLAAPSPCEMSNTQWFVWESSFVQLASNHAGRGCDIKPTRSHANNRRNDRTRGRAHDGSSKRIPHHPPATTSSSSVWAFVASPAASVGRSRTPDSWGSRHRCWSHRNSHSHTCCCCCSPPNADWRLADRCQWPRASPARRRPWRTDGRAVGRDTCRRCARSCGRSCRRSWPRLLSPGPRTCRGRRCSIRGCSLGLCSSGSSRIGRARRAGPATDGGYRHLVGGGRSATVVPPNDVAREERRRPLISSFSHAEASRNG